MPKNHMKKKAKKTIKKTAGVKTSGISNGVRPLGDRVLIKELEGNDGTRTTESGIFIPDGADKDRDSRKGKVVAVGPGKHEDGRLVPLGVKAGDIVLFQWGDKVKIEGEEYYLVREAEISAVVKK